MRTKISLSLAALGFTGLIVLACGGADGPRGFSDQASSSGASGGASSGILGGGDDGGSSSGSAGCTGIQCQQKTCSNGGKTTVSGTVFAPTPATFGKADPIYNAILYIPNSQLTPFPAGVSCDKCGAVTSGDPIATTLSGSDGKFTLENVPVGANIPLVIQVGRWRRQVTIPAVAECTDTPLDAELTRLPRNQTEGDIPLMAIVTSAYDATECLMRKIGIDDTEFTNATGAGRVHLYQGAGSQLAGGGSNGSALWGSPTELQKYDVVALPCNSQPTTGTDRQHLVDYANGGGRLYITDLSQDVIKSGPAQWPATAKFDLGGYLGTATAQIDATFPKGQALAEWLNVAGASPTKGQLALEDAYTRLSAVNAPSQRWIYTSGSVQTYSFNTPVGSDTSQQCGRAFYSSFHVTTGTGGTFPQHCSSAPMTPQEKALEFMLFDLSACVQKDDAPPAPPPVVK